MKRRNFLHTALGSIALSTLAKSQPVKYTPESNQREPYNNAPLQLDQIQFAYDADPNIRAIFLRWNEKEPVQTPEWQRMANGKEISNPIAYYSTRDNFKKVKAKFTLIRQNDKQWYSIRAVYANSPQKIALSKVNGTTFFDSKTQFEWHEFEWIEKPDDFQKINIYDIPLLWQVVEGPLAEDPEKWQNFATSNHKIYVIYNMPQNPWTGEKNHACNPWVEVLDLACQWAKGATTEEDAATLITKQIYNMGRDDNSFQNGRKVFGYKSGISYSEDFRISGDTIKSPYFELTKFLAYLKDKKAGVMGGACHEWATIVLTFSNILGCELNLKRFQTTKGGFPLNAVLLIGSQPNNWITRKTHSDDDSTFGYHVVAAKYNGLSEDLIYDACLAVDEKAGISIPYKALVPTGMPFGPVTDPKSYLYHLIEPAEREKLHFFSYPAGMYPNYFPIIRS